MSAVDFDRNSIWSFAQNKPTLVARDLAEYGVSEDVTFTVLLKRGVFKWLAARRDIIKIKNVWRDHIRGLHEERAQIKARLRAGQGQRGDAKRIAEIRGELRGYERCRKDVRRICHSERWRAPDFDTRAQRWLDANEEPR